MFRVESQKHPSRQGQFIVLFRIIRKPADRGMPAFFTLNGMPSYSTAIFLSGKAKSSRHFRVG